MTQIMLRDFDHSLCVLFKAIDISVWDTFRGNSQDRSPGYSAISGKGLHYTKRGAEPDIWRNATDTTVAPLAI